LYDYTCVPGEPVYLRNSDLNISQAGNSLSVIIILDSAIDCDFNRYE